MNSAEVRCHHWHFKLSCDVGYDVIRSGVAVEYQIPVINSSGVNTFAQHQVSMTARSYSACSGAGSQTNLLYKLLRSTIVQCESECFIIMVHHFI